MKKILKRLCTGFLALATVVTALPSTPVHAESKQYWTESAERVGIIEKVMNDGSIGSTFNEGYMKVEGETAYCIDINTDFKNGYKTRADASSRMSADQISDVALSLEYVKQYGEAHKELNYKQVYLLEQCVVWQRLSVHLGWQCDNVRASYDEIPKATQDEVFAGARAFVKENKGRYEYGGYIYSGEGQELGQFWAKLNVVNAKLQKTSSNTSITDGNGNYSIAGATYGVFSDKDCTKQLAPLTTDENGNTDIVEVKAGTVYIKELSAPAGYKVDKTVYSLKVEAGKTATLKVSDTPKVTDTLIELFKIDMETQKDNPQGNASLAGAEFTWKYYAGFYNKDNLPAEATRTWVTKTIAETDSDGTTHYITKLADAYKVSGDSFYMQDGKAVLPLGTLTVEETKAPNGYLLEGAYMQAGDKSEQIKGLYVTQITEDGDLAVLSGSNQFSVSDKVIRGGVKIQKRDLETGDTKPQGSATLNDTAFDIISLNDNSVLVEGKLYKKNEVVKTIHTDLEGVASTSADLLPYGNFRIVESEAPDGYLTDGAKPIDFTITENGKIVDLTDKAHSIYNQIKRGDIEGVKIGAGTHKRLADVPFRITSKTTGENHVVVTDDNGQFSTSADWASHKHNTNAGKTSEDGVWFGTSEPDDSKGALPYDTYIIEEMRCDSNKGFELIPPFEIVVSRNNLVVDLGTLTDEYEKEISIHTTATSKDGEKTILAGKEVTIVDTYPINHIENIVRPISSAPAAKNVIFLSADAFGVLPPVSILTEAQTQYYFLSGFTAKLAGTERGITEPTPTFSACFGQAFLELHPTKYAEELVKKMEKSGAKAYLVNTGWNGTGKRISIKDTRGIIDAILNGDILNAPTKKIPFFDFEVPTELNGVDTGILDPRDTYANASEWEEKAKDLAGRFIKNFAKYEGNAAGKALVAAGPQL